MDGESTPQAYHVHCLKTCSNPSLDLGSIVYLLGHVDKKELAVGEGKVTIATDNLIKLSTDGLVWPPGSAGFDVQGNLAFMICDPMKLATSPATKSSSTSSSSSSSWKKDLPAQFGIPIPIICDWLSQHWEGSLDELSKPKLPIIRLMSSGHRSEYSSASFTQRKVFKSSECDNTENDSVPRLTTLATNVSEEGIQPTQPHCTHDQGIPTPEIYESPRLASEPVKTKENRPTHLLNINFPPRTSRGAALPLPLRQLLPCSDENFVDKQASFHKMDTLEETGSSAPERDGGEFQFPNGSPNGLYSECQSSSSPVETSVRQRDRGRFHPDYSSDGETMYSAETMESRNFPSPKEGRFQQVGRSHSCVSYSRWSSPQKNTAARRGTFEKQRSLCQEGKVYSQPGMSQRTRSNDYYSPTVSSIMKKRNEQPPKPRQNVVQMSPRWNF